jgi:hypothetical protein
MGYYTNFELTIHEGTADVKEVRLALYAVLQENPQDNEFLFVIEADLIVTGDSIKWYDHDEDCAELSKKFPGVVFKLHGKGEESGDLWDAYYKDGKVQICRAKMTFPPYDPAKLKSVQQAQREDEGRP